MAIPVASRATYLQCAFKYGFWSGNTAPTSFYDVANFTKAEITNPVQEADVLPSNMEGSIGEALASINKPTEAANISLEADYMAPALMALLLGADITELSQTTAAVTDEAVTLALGLWVPLANQHLSPHSVGTPFVLETDGTPDVEIASTKYEVDYINGLIKALHADAVGAKLATYHTATRTGEIYKGGKVKSSYVKLVGTATEKVSEKRCRIIIHKASLAAASAFDPVAGGYVKGTFAGDLLTPTGETSPWQYEYLDLAA